LSESLHATVVGTGAVSTGGASTVLGEQAQGTGSASTAVGALAQAAEYSTAVGADANAGGDHAVAIGQTAYATKTDSNAIGANAWATGTRANAFGSAARASGDDATAIGRLANASGTGSFAMGTGVTTAGERSIAMGSGASTSVGASDSIAMGTNAKTSNEFDVAIGLNATAVGGSAGATALGGKTSALAPNSVAVGNQVTVKSGGAIGIAGNWEDDGLDHPAIDDASEYAIAIGNDAQVTKANGGVALGHSAKVNAEQSIAIGQSAVAKSDHGVALGSSSVADREAGVAGYVPLTTNGGSAQRNAISATTSTLGAVSVGDAANGQFRQITGVAAGSEDSDAVNLAQLKSTETHFYSVNDDGVEGGDFNNYDNDGASGAGALAAGVNAIATGAHATAVGEYAQANAADSVAVGHSAVVSSNNSDGGVAIGSYAFSGGSQAIAIGGGAVATGAQATALGEGAKANNLGGVALGSRSIADRAAGVAGYVPTGAQAAQQAAIAATASTLGAVSVGDAATGQFRQITDVAAGSEDSDAVNLSQLKAVGSAAEAGQTHYYSVNDNGVQGGNYDNDGATGINALAAGADTTAAGEKAVAMGYDSHASGKMGLAMGAHAESSGDGVAVGNNAGNGTADSTGSVMIGQGAGSLNGTAHNTAVGASAGRNVQGVDGYNTAIGSINTGSNITGDYNTSVGHTAGFAIQGDYNNSMGVNAGQNSIGDANVSIGAGSGKYVEGDNNVALGAGANGTGTAAQRLKVSNAVAVGIGAITQQDNAVAIGNGAVASIVSGVALGHGSMADRQAGVAGYVPSAADAEQQATIAATTGTWGAVSVGNAAAGQFRQITGVAAGSEDSDAANVAQLKAVGSAASDEIDAAKTHYYSVNDNGVQGGNYGNDGATGDNAIAAGSNARATGINAVAMGNGAQANGDNSISIGAGNVVGGARSGAIGDPNHIDADDSYAIGNNNSIAAGANQSFVLGNNVSVTHANNVVLGDDSEDRTFAQVDDATVPTTTATLNPDGSVSYGPGPAITYGGFAGTAVGVVSVGRAGAERQIINVAPGAITATSTDAVNGSQLYSLSSKVDTIGGSIDTIVNNAQSHYYSVNDGGTQQANFDNAGAAGANSIASGVGASTAAGATGSVALGANATASTANSVALGAGSTTGAAVASAGTTIRGTEYTFAGGNPAGVVSVGAEGAERQIQNVAAGQLNAASTDAVNGSQLYATNQALESISATANAGINVTTSATGTGVAKGSSVTKVGPGGTATYTAGDNMVVTQSGTNIAFSVSDRPTFNEVTVGDTKITNEGLSIQNGPSITQAGIDANNTAITNVQAGVAPTDAVNVQQLEQARAETNARVNQLGNELEDARQDSDGGASAAMAMANLPQAFLPGKSMLSAGVGSYGGEAAMAIGMSKLSENGRWVVKVSGSADSRGKFGVGAGAGFHW